jgi:hypothetical protein
MNIETLSPAAMQEINGGLSLGSLGTNLLLNLTGALNTSNPTVSSLNLTGVLSILGVVLGIGASGNNGNVGLTIVAATPSL